MSFIGGMSLQMSSQVSLPFASEFTVWMWTFEWCQIRVNRIHVNLKVPFPFGFLRAEGATERLFIPMDFDVTHQMGFPSEFQVTNGTRETFLLHVNQLVKFQISRRRTGILAIWLLAFERRFPSVRSPVND